LIKKLSQTNIHESEKISHVESQAVNDLGTVNLLGIRRWPRCHKLAIFLASNKMNHDDIKRITGITLLS
jgi:hypothetical protein